MSALNYNNIKANDLFANIVILKNAISAIKLPQNSNVIFCKIGLCSRTGKIDQNPPSGPKDPQTKTPRSLSSKVGHKTLYNNIKQY